MEKQASTKLKGGNSSNLKRGYTGKKYSTPLSPEQEQFCVYRARGLRLRPISALLDMSVSSLWRWSMKPEIEKRIEVVREGFRKKIFEEAAEDYVMDVEHFDIECTRVASMKKQHKFRGFSDKVKAIELAYRRLKAIEPSVRVNATAVAGAQATAAAGGTMETIYKAKWLVEKEAQLAAKFTAELQGNVVEGGN